MSHICAENKIKMYSSEDDRYYYVCSECGMFIEWTT
jgi:hypothetical protein